MIRRARRRSVLPTAALLPLLAAGLLTAPLRAQSPSAADLVAQAQAERANDALAPALSDYLAAMSAPADGDAARGDARAGLLDMVAASGLPHRLTAAQMLQCRDASSLLTVQDAPRGVVLVGLDGGDGRSLNSLVDPQNGWPFPALVAAYVQDPADDPAVAGTYRLICTAHYQTLGDAALSGHADQLLVLLRSVLIARTGQQPVYESPFQVWLSRSDATAAGGEEWRNNIYLYDVADDRSSIEWIREIAHEYAHLAVPALGGDYTAPEAWANGYAGERLLVRWLADPAVAGPAVVETVWGRTFAGYPNFAAHLVAPPLRLFTDTGLDRADLDRRDATGTRYLIGLLLWVDQARGSRALGRLLWNLDTPNPSALYAPVKAMNPPAGTGAAGR